MKLYCRLPYTLVAEEIEMWPELVLTADEIVDNVYKQIITATGKEVPHRLISSLIAYIGGTMIPSNEKGMSYIQCKIGRTQIGVIGVQVYNSFSDDPESLESETAISYEDENNLIYIIFSIGSKVPNWLTKYMRNYYNDSAERKRIIKEMIQETNIAIAIPYYDLAFWNQSLRQYPIKFLPVEGSYLYYYTQGEIKTPRVEGLFN